MNVKTRKEAAIIIMQVARAQACPLLKDLLNVDFKDREIRKSRETHEKLVLNKRNVM